MYEDNNFSTSQSENDNSYLYGGDVYSEAIESDYDGDDVSHGQLH